MSNNRKDRASSAIRALATLLLCAACLPAAAADAGYPPPIKIAVFDFELDDVSAAGAAALADSAADSTHMQAVTAEARRLLVQSGRYSLIETHGVDAAPVKQGTLRSCNGCDVGIALKLGADQSLIGVITRVAKTEYYVSLLITDTRTGKAVDGQTAFFTGADDAWASGVRVLLRHGVLADTK